MGTSVSFSQVRQTFRDDVAGNSSVYGVHRVTEGQTLYTIAKMYKMSIMEIKELNQMDNSVIFPGDPITVILSRAQAATQNTRSTQGSTRSRADYPVDLSDPHTRPELRQGTSSQAYSSAHAETHYYTPPTATSSQPEVVYTPQPQYIRQPQTSHPQTQSVYPQNPTYRNEAAPAPTPQARSLSIEERYAMSAPPTQTQTPAQQRPQLNNSSPYQENRYNNTRALPNQAYGNAYEQSRSIPQNTRSSSPQTVNRYKYYRVKAGENLYSIATRYHVHVDQLKEWNAKNSVKEGDVIIVGKTTQEVKDPGMGSRAVSPRPTQRSSVAFSSNQSSFDALQSPQPSTQAPRAYESRGFAQPPSSNTSYSSYAPVSYQAAAQPREDIQDYLPSYPNHSHFNAYHTPQESASSTPRGMPSYDPVTQHISAGYGSYTEEGPYIRFENAQYETLKFYGLHKTLTPGSRLRMQIPHNPGYLEVTVVGYLPENVRAVVGLSPACIMVLELAGNANKVRIVY